jgi:protein SCO1/2
MRAHALLCVLLFSGLGGWAGCTGASDRREFALHGQVLSFSGNRLEASIKHDDIKGFMPGMTMPYKVRDAKAFEGVAAGDIIDATLVVVSNDAYLKDVRKVGQAPLEPASAEVAAPSARSGFELLKDGEPVPQASFVDQDGKARDIRSFKGSALVVTFMYTRCPMPTMCPLMDHNFAAIQRKLQSDRGLDVHLLSVSFDPLTDTPAVLKSHARDLGADPKLWTFVTGDRDAIDQFAARFGVAIERAEDDPLNITHNLRTAIIDRAGNLVKTYTGNEWTPEQVLADIKVLVGVD